MSLPIFLSPCACREYIVVRYAFCNRILSLFLVLAACWPVMGIADDAVRWEEIRQRIIGGSRSQVGAWPWMAALLDSWGEPFCGGVLIHPKWVLTAAHCVPDYSGSSNPLGGLRVVLGRNRLSATGGEEIDANRVIPHWRYDEYTSDNDIALVRLARPSSQTLLAVLTPEQESDLAGVGIMAQVLGWGMTGPNDWNSYSDALRQVNVPIVNNETCNAAMEDVTENMICAGFETGGKDSCQGDSGGPLFVPDGKEGYMLAGVSSWGFDCAAPGTYGVYTRISRYIEWIHHHGPSIPVSMPLPGISIHVDGIGGKGDVAPYGSPNGLLDISDAVVTVRMFMGLIEDVDQDYLMKADLAPLGNPDGVVNVSDAVVIVRLAMGLESLDQ